MVRGADPVLSAVAAVLLIILGLLVIAYPVLLTWGIGIGLILAGVALLASIAAAGRTRF
jgi:hypothetical protein